MSDPDQLDEVIQMVNDLGLQVLENAPDEGSDFVANAAQNAQPAITENEMGTIESEVGRTTDPVRLYMREMGSVDLLTREGEITIAKSIEEGARDLLHACAHFPGIIEEVLLEYALIKKEDNNFPKFTLYAIRHAYARRLIKRNIPDSTCALSMGNDVRIFKETYLRAMNKRDMTEIQKNL